MKKKLIGIFIEKVVLVGFGSEANDLYGKGRFGEIIKENLQLSLLESLYLVGKGKLIVVNQQNKEISENTLMKKAVKQEPNFWTRFCVYKDMRDRGYVVKTALKFGADFRVYDRGVKPGEAHAKWILYPVQESSGLTWHEFAAKNRVAHSTKKKLMVGVVDDEADVSYWEIRWLRP